MRRRLVCSVSSVTILAKASDLSTSYLKLDMPAPKSFLRQMAQFNLDPKKAYTKADVGHDGHIRSRVERPAVVTPAPKPTPKKEEAPKAKPTEAVKPVSAAPSAPKSDKPAKPIAEVKKVEAAKVPQATGEKASDESTVEPKESTDPAAPTNAGADASTVKPA